ncbi:MAG TPA: bifunctional UDP-N-acetylglucosamine diphosphorylase/glucosamine-1-phosphate N-acetyltransferase GlmU [Gammaproteobacteria bacterium]|nr:bifunctional UDP-N-acetylglucosamine diphosphorylase/glucosamine-1-phosphate N-acetyltransferase GlmU [Gammaproteobacteria bacterium]
MSHSVIILAAGEGKRMRSARPKVLAELAGRPLLAHVIDTARMLDPRNIVIVVHGQGGHLVRANFPDTDLSWVEQVERRGTADAVHAALPELPKDGSVLVLYGDVPLLQADTLAPLLESADRDELAVLTARLDDPFGYGRIVRDESGAVQKIVEERDANETERSIREINTGVVAAPADRLSQWIPRIENDNAQGEYYLTDTLALAVADGVKVRTVEVGDPASTAGVNNRAQLAAAERELRRRSAAALMASGVTLVDPERIDVRGRLECGHDVHIEPNCVFEGHVVLGSGVRVDAGVVIRDAWVGDGTHLRAYSVIENAKIGAEAVVGPYARLRPGTELGDAAHVGNFVELKNTHLGHGSKANHLAYLGDAEIGQHVNVGAGVITCNYDGANKHKTVIGDDAFIGSDSPLVAPVTIGEGATIGAGSTVTADVPPGKLVLARSRQTMIEGWERPRKTRSDPDKQ